MKVRICFAPSCDTTIPLHMPFCATHMQNGWTKEAAR